jgi:ATP-dependent Clp protease adaptor protein ClpS
VTLDSRLRGNELENLRRRRREEPCSGHPRYLLKWEADAPASQVSMADPVTKPRVKLRPKTKRPPLHKVILLNDDYTPREFVVMVLKAVFRMSEEQAYNVMMTAHRKGVCVIAVYVKDVAETKATEATELGRSKGYPLAFTTEPEE